MPLIRHITFTYLETVFKIVVFLQEESIVDDNLWGGYTEIDDPIIHRLGGLNT